VVRLVTSTASWGHRWSSSATSGAASSRCSKLSSTSSSGPGYTAPSGPPLYLLLGDVPAVTATDFRVAGSATALSTCLLTETTYTNPDAGSQSLGRAVLSARHAVVIMPQAPLTDGTYCVSITNNGTPSQWSFAVGTPPAGPGCGQSQAGAAAPTPTPTPAAAAPAPTASTVAGTPWGIGTNSQITHYDAQMANPQTVDGAAVRIALGPGGQPWVVDSSGQIWRRATGTTGYVDGTWQLVPGSATASVLWTAITALSRGWSAARRSVAQDARSTSSWHSR